MTDDAPNITITNNDTAKRAILTVHVAGKIDPHFIMPGETKTFQTTQLAINQSGQLAALNVSGLDMDEVADDEPFDLEEELDGTDAA